ncbi:hypothetical protein DFH06DRAFT_1328886 [Mycena polygramma]|nr:hypothetical protein DFH06DRAFT_1328886 [Mycena polygramma]
MRQFTAARETLENQVQQPSASTPHPMLPVMDLEGVSLHGSRARNGHQCNSFPTGT